MTQPDADLPNPPDNTPHKPADDREEIYFEGSPLLRGHVSRLAGWTFLALLLFAGAVLSARNALWLAALPLALLGLAFLFIPLLLTRTIRYRISNYRIDYERGLLSRRIDTLELWHVEDLSFQQSLLDRILGVGNIRIISHDQTTPELLLAGLPNPRPLFASLEQRIIAVKRQRGVIKMDAG